jgi:protein-disulfide isomerase
MSVIALLAAVAGTGFVVQGTRVAPASAAAESLAPAAAPGNVQLVEAELRPDDRFIGAADAPVTMIEYASLTCPHCADFHRNTLPKLKEEYIDTGKVRLVYRDFPLDEAGLRAAMLARCVERPRYFGLIDVLFGSQEGWSRAKDPVAALRTIGRLAGIDDQAFDACMADQELEKSVLTSRMTGARQHDVRSTPTFIINDRKMSGALPFEDFVRILRPLIPDS